MEPEDLKYSGKCKKCGVDVFHSDSEPVCEESNVGDYDFVCYPCQFKMMDNGSWDTWKQQQLINA